MRTADKNICINCGLCCDGTLFPFAKIEDNEIIDPTFSFNTYYSEEGLKRFSLPCCYLKDKTCTIYNNRPYSICSTFNCKQLKSFLANTVTYEEAIRNINKAIFLKESIEKALLINFPHIQESSFNDKLKMLEQYNLEHEEPMNFRRKYSQLFLDIGKFMLVTKKYFYNENEIKK